MSRVLCGHNAAQLLRGPVGFMTRRQLRPDTPDKISFQETVYIFFPVWRSSCIALGPTREANNDRIFSNVMGGSDPDEESFRNNANACRRVRAPSPPLLSQLVGFRHRRSYIESANKRDFV